MSYSVLRKEGKKHLPAHLFQEFSQEEWESYPFAGEEKLRWFRDAKLGLFFHVGISALGKVDIGWSRHTHKLPDPGTGPIPDEVYDGWAEQIKMEAFDADEWIDLAVRSGFKYVVIITKHHDGFHMWDTAYSDYKITNAPMGRDYLGELITACNKREMPVGLYFSQRDWHHPDYEPVDTENAVRMDHPPFFEMKDGQSFRCGAKHAGYIRYMHSAVLELMQKYGKIDILWWDACCYDGMFREEMWDALALEKKVRELQPHILINNRASVPGDFDTPEGHVGFVQRSRAWETCMPLGNHWAWTGEGIKSFKAILHQFIQTVSGDGNYLLSIGTMPNGKLPPEESERMLALGDWLKLYGEAVYGTRSGPWNPGRYGGSVYRDDTVYLHLLASPESGVLRLPLGDYRIAQIECLTEEKPAIEICDNVLCITLPEEDFTDVIVRIKMKEAVRVSDEGIAAEE